MESTLATTYDEIRERIGFLRGFGTDKDEWTDAQKERINFSMRDGLRMAYSAFDWSFLKPTIEFTIPSASSSVQLPDDFHYLCGDIYFVSDTLAYLRPLTVENDGKVMLAQQKTPNYTGPPTIAAVRSATNPTGMEGQRQELIYWPTADQDYTVRFKYSVLPGALSATRQYPYGGASFSQVLLAACQAASESSVDGQPGAFMQLYQLELQKAIAQDRRRGAEVISHRNRDVRLDTQNVTYNGLTS